MAIRGKHFRCDDVNLDGVLSCLMILGFYFLLGTNIAVICFYPFRNLIFHGTNINGGKSVSWEAAYDPR